jgi:hypothetical protein
MPDWCSVTPGMTPWNFQPQCVQPIAVRGDARRNVVPSRQGSAPMKVR